MNLRRLLPLLPLFVASALCAQDDEMAKVDIKTEAAAPGVYMLTGAGGNLGLMTGPDAVFLIDDEFAPLTPKIRAAVALLSAQQIKFLINTHWHGDHTGGNKDHGEAGVLIIAHENVRKRLAAGQAMEYFKAQVPPAPAAALPVVTFTDGITFHLNGETITVRHMPPAHTDGDSVIHFEKAGVWHLADLFFNGFYPFIDTGSGGSVDGLIADAETLLPLIGPAEKVIPGHGPMGSKADYQAYHDMLKTVRDRIAPLVRAGKSRAQVIAAKPTADLDAKWGGGFMNPDDFAGLMYDGIKQDQARPRK